MAIRDLRTAPDNTLLHADIAIVGGGPAGITIARELANTPLHILVVDSGGLRLRGRSPGSELGREYW